MTAALSAQSRPVRIANLLKTVHVVQAHLDELARVESAQASGLLELLHNTTSRVEEICRAESATPAQLPDPSRRAYSWLKFLSEAENLQVHLAGLRLAIQAGQQAACRKKRPQVLVEFYHLPALYRTRASRGAILLSASEGFITAPPAVLEALICSALLRKDEYTRIVRAYGDTDEYAGVLQALEMEDQPDGAASRGKVFDLNEIFARVNAEYFDGRMPRPRLTWNRTLTRRKLGHYQPATDTVMISISLDHPRVPAYILDYVMYHELLHKHLGIQAINGRRYAHTKAFKEEERKFSRFIEAEKFLADFFDKTWRA